MNLIYLRPSTPKARKFIKKKLRGRDSLSIYGIQAGDCCMAPAPVKRSDYLLTFLHDVSPEMLSFIYATGLNADACRN